MIINTCVWCMYIRRNIICVFFFCYSLNVYHSGNRSFEQKAKQPKISNNNNNIKCICIVKKVAWFGQTNDKLISNRKKAKKKKQKDITYMYILVCVDIADFIINFCTEKHNIQSLFLAFIFVIITHLLFNIENKYFFFLHNLLLFVSFYLLLYIFILYII